MSPSSTVTALADSVADTIRQRLVNGKLHAGQRLSEASLCEQLQVSRNTLREGFRILIKEGLLHHEPNRGVSVIVPSMADIIDIYRVRRLLECQALLQAWPRHPAQQQMQHALQQAYAAREAGDWQTVGTMNIAFHAGIVGLTDSTRLMALFSNIAAELRLAFGQLNDPEYLHSPYVEQNAQLLQLFQEGRTHQAAKMLEEYLIQSERMVLAAYARQSESG